MVALRQPARILRRGEHRQLHGVGLQRLLACALPQSCGVDLLGRLGQRVQGGANRCRGRPAGGRVENEHGHRPERVGAGCAAVRSAHGLADG
ncbi:hypothetical protein SDC9_131192 [bioreactor metagenome]|uniref:Uncharacterized protein n=1 Tax=bioreactor metagenome TaxID=1076179 RepID=A0A645D4I9_9ZZZZ